MKSGKISIAVPCGLIAGLVLILLTTLLYLGGVNSFLGYGGWFGYLLLIAAAVVAPVMKKKGAKWVPGIQGSFERRFSGLCHCPAVADPLYLDIDEFHRYEFP